MASKVVRLTSKRLVVLGGEFESLVLDCPLFKKRLCIDESHVVKSGEFTAQLVVDKVRLVEKGGC